MPPAGSDEDAPGTGEADVGDSGGVPLEHAARAAQAPPLTDEDKREVAAALQRRVDDVIAAAHAREARTARRPRGPGPASGRGLAGSDVTAGGRAVGAVAFTAAEAERVPAGVGAAGLDEDGAPEQADEALTVAQFYDRVKRALAREFLDEVWVTGEIRGLREARGHHYIELADEGASVGGRAAAQQLEVVCWARDWPPVELALAEAGVSLEVGRVVRVRGRVSVWEGGSKLRFTLTALDVEALLGGIAAARHRLLAALAAEDLLDANRRLRLPLVPLRLGVVTSPGSEAHRDFTGQLARSGFAFEVHLERCLVQGPDAPTQVAAALRRLAVFAPDLAVVVRGGGARGDLAAFDSEEVARAIALAPFPVWTGIGHTGDRSVADEVAQRALITPTACGEAVVAQVAAYWDGIGERLGVLAGLARARLDGAEHRVEGGRGALARAARHQLDRRSDGLRVARSVVARGVGSSLGRETAVLAARARALGGCGRRLVVQQTQEVHRRQQVLGAYDPRRQLERGWSLTRDSSGRLVRSVAELSVGDRLTTRLADGEAVSRVESAIVTVPSMRPDGGVRDDPGGGEADRGGST